MILCYRNNNRSVKVNEIYNKIAKNHQSKFGSLTENSINSKLTSVTLRQLLSQISFLVHPFFLSSSPLFLSPLSFLPFSQTTIPYLTRKVGLPSTLKKTMSTRPKPSKDMCTGRRNIFPEKWTQTNIMRDLNQGENLDTITSRRRLHRKH